MADLELKPDFVFSEKPKFDTLVSNFETGYEQRRAKMPTALLSWRLSYKNRSSSDRDTIKNLFESKKGRLSSFTWDHPVTGTDYTVRFSEDEIEFHNHSYGLYDFEFSLMQVK